MLPFCCLHSAFYSVSLKIFLHHLLDFIPLDFHNFFVTVCCALLQSLRYLPGLRLLPPALTSLGTEPIPEVRLSALPDCKWFGWENWLWPQDSKWISSCFAFYISNFYTNFFLLYKIRFLCTLSSFFAYLQHEILYVLFWDSLFDKKSRQNSNAQEFWRRYPYWQATFFVF